MKDHLYWSSLADEVGMGLQFYISKQKGILSDERMPDEKIIKFLETGRRLIKEILEGDELWKKEHGEGFLKSSESQDKGTSSEDRGTRPDKVKE